MIGQYVSFKRMGNSPDMSYGKIINVSDKGIQVEFHTKRHTWDKETRTWIAGTFVRTIKNLMHMEVINA